jgi:hypothetical protein
LSIAAGFVEFVSLLAFATVQPLVVRFGDVGEPELIAGAGPCNITSDND